MNSFVNFTNNFLKTDFLQNGLIGLSTYILCKMYSIVSATDTFVKSDSTSSSLTLHHHIQSLCLLFFIKFLFFTRSQPFKNYGKCFLFHQKISFRSQDIPVFKFLSTHLFLPVSHCFRGCLKINIKAYDVIDCLNKNLIHFV